MPNNDTISNVDEVRLLTALYDARKVCDRAEDACGHLQALGDLLADEDVHELHMTSEGRDGLGLTLKAAAKTFTTLRLAVEEIFNAMPELTKDVSRLLAARGEGGC